MLLVVFVGLGCEPAEEVVEEPVEEPVDEPEEEVEEYPRRPINLIVPAGAGGGTDVLARALAANAGEHFLQPIIVRNVPGGEFTIGITEVLQSEPDGYTLGLTPTDPLVFAPHQLDLEYDIDDIFFFDTVALGAAALTVNPELGIDNVDDLLEYASENPNELQIAQSNLRFEMCVELLRDAGYEFENVPFPDGGETIAAIAGGHVDISLTSVAAAEGLHEAGQAQIIMTTVPEIVEIEGVPTIADHPEVEEILGQVIDTTLGVIAPQGIPEERIQFIEEALQKTFDEEGFSAMATRMGLPPLHVGMEEFEASTYEEYRIAEDLIERLE